MSILLLTWSFGSDEPVYKGKRLTAWISDLSNAVILARQSKSAEEAIKQIGTNALPVILDELRVPDDSAFVKAVHVKYKYSPFARTSSPVRLPHREAEVRRTQAAYALRILAPSLGLSTLTNLLHDPNSQVQKAAAEALVNGFIIEGVEVLMHALGSDSVRVRLAALQGLLGAGYAPQEIAPLIRCLGDPDPAMRTGAASWLAHFGSNYGHFKVPGLIEGLDTAARDNDPSVRAAAQRALAVIRPGAASELASPK